MKPLPSERATVDRKKTGAPKLPTPLPSGGPIRSGTNRKIPAKPNQRLYPWLLLLATGVAGIFCYLYITKPVFYSSPQMGLETKSPGPNANTPEKSPPILPAAPHTIAGPATDRLPGDLRPEPTPQSAPPPKPSSTDPYEETNFQVQHVITAEAPNGIVKRLDFKVPVIYRSRNLRWSKEEVATARTLLGQLADYQEKTRALRAEGAALSAAWNQLIEHSIPIGGLQADSPSLPNNQETTRSTANPRSVEAIHIQPANK